MWKFLFLVWFETGWRHRVMFEVIRLLFFLRKQELHGGRYCMLSSYREEMSWDFLVACRYLHSYSAKYAFFYTAIFADAYISMEGVPARDGVRHIECVLGVQWGFKKKGADGK